MNWLSGLLGLLGSAGGIGAALHGGNLMENISTEDITGLNTANQQGYQNFLKQFQANQNLGQNFLNTELNAQQNYSENIAQAYISNIQAKNMQNAALWGGLSQGLLSFVPKFSFEGEV